MVQIARVVLVDPDRNVRMAAGFLRSQLGDPAAERERQTAIDNEPK